MATHKRNEITIETDRVLIIRRKSRRVWCQQCGREVDSVGLQEAGRLSGPRQLALPGNVESEAWHVCAGGNSELVICLESLLKSMGNDAEVRNLIFKRSI